MGRLLNSVPGRIVQKFLDDKAPTWAVVIAWNGLFALFPIVVFVAAVLGQLASAFGRTPKAIDAKLLGVFPGEEARGAASQALYHFQQQQGLLFLIGIIGLLWGGSALFGAMEQAFSTIYHTKPRDFVQQKLVALAMVLLFIIIGGSIVVSSAILPALQSMHSLPSFLTEGSAAVAIQVALGIVGGFIFYAAVYFVIPNKKQVFIEVVPGAIVAGVLFELVTLLFPLYIALTNNVAIYGAQFGLFFVILTFFLFVGLITMLGVEINSVLFPVDAAQMPQALAPMTAANGARGPVRQGVKRRTALLIAVGASVIGVLLGRRSAGAD